MSKRDSRRKRPAVSNRPSTALARRAPAVARALERRLHQAMTTTAAAPPSLPDAPIIAMQFVGTLKLTKPQIAALRRPLASHEIEWKPAKEDGPPVIPYVAHTAARDRLDEAFGLGGWGMAPLGVPKMQADLVIAPYALVVGGVPRVMVWGECPYIATNRNMSYGDALEGSKSNAIVRCGKELGIGRELWSKNGRSKLSPPGGRPFAGGRRGGKQEAMHSMQPGYDSHQNEPITRTWKDKDGKKHSGQLERLWAIIRSSGRTEDEIKSWLAVAYNYGSTKDIKRRDYDAICKAIEHPGPLPAPGELTYERQPGEDD